jgi:hypothetical protein
MITVGDPDCAGAIFIYKQDDSIAKALAAAAEVARQHKVNVAYTDAEKARLVSVLGYDPTDSNGRFVYVVHADTKADLLCELAAWLSRVDNNAAALMVYSHGGSRGINRKTGDAVHRVTWQELSESLPGGVSSLWLAGCRTRHCLDAWQEADVAPVKSWLVCTHASESWLKMIPSFQLELSMDPVFEPAEIANRLRDAFRDRVEILERRTTWVPL